LPITRTDIGRDALRRQSFLFQDGMVLCATLRGIDAIGLLEPSPSCGRASRAAGSRTCASACGRSRRQAGSSPSPP
jgi:hypothetical protein